MTTHTTSIETLIRRSATAPVGVSEAEIASGFVAEGVSPEMAFLAAVAGTILAAHIGEETVSDED